MNAIDSMPADDFARDAVQQGNAASGFRLALIIVGGIIGFSVYVISAGIGGSLGFAKAAAAFSIGSLILGVMGAWTSYVGAKSRLSTYLLTEFAFGRRGARLVNLAVALSLVGWYGVICNTLGNASQQMILEAAGLDLSPYLTVSVASALMITITALGFTGIDRLALYMVPLMLLFMLAAAALALQQGDAGLAASEESFSLHTAISAVVGTYIAGVIIQPDYSRFAVSTRHAIWSVFVALGIVFPIVQILAAIPGMALGEQNIVKMMSLIGFLLPGFCLMFLGAWASNVLCLYSAGLSFATLLKRIHLRHIVLALGVAGTSLAFIPAQAYIMNFLVVLGVMIPPIGVIYVLDAMLIRKFAMSLKSLEDESSIRWSAIISWAMGALAGFATEATGFGIVGIASLDSVLVASLLFCSLEFRRIRPAAHGGTRH